MRAERRCPRTLAMVRCTRWPPQTAADGRFDVTDVNNLAAPVSRDRGSEVRDRRFTDVATFRHAC